MKQLIRIAEEFVNEVKVNTITFTYDGVLFLQENYPNAKRVPSADTKYIPSDTAPNNYCLYFKPFAKYWTTSAFLTNFKLSEYMQILLTVQNKPEQTKVNASDDEELYTIGLGKELPELKSELLSEFAKDQNTPVVDIKLQQPTDEQLQQAIDNIAAKSYIDSLRGKNFNFYRSLPHVLDECLKDEPVPEISTGGACEYYRVGVTHPMSKDQVPYIAECGDIMESLEMTYAEANMFKEIWRTAAERTLGLKKAGNTNKRAAEKMVFFADRYYQQNVHQANITNSRVVFKKK